MTPGAKAALGFYGSMLVWDFLHLKDGQTLSEAVARGIADKRTRYPLSALLLCTVFHLFTLSRTVNEEPIPLGSPGNLGLERFEGLRAIGFPA